MKPNAADTLISSRTTRFAALLKKSSRSPRVGALKVAPRLLVRDGLHAGAWLTLRGTSMSVGSGDHCDVVLSDADVPREAGGFFPTLGGWCFQRAVAQARVFDTEPLDDAAIQCGSTALNPERESGPIVSPESETRHGRFRRRRWSLHGVTLVVIDLTAPPAMANARSVSRLKYFTWVATATVLVACGLLAFVFAVAPSVESKIVQARESLAAAGFKDVVLRRAEGRHLVLTGFVEDATELSRLKTWVQGVVHFQVKLQVKSGQELAQRVRDALGDADSIRVSYQTPGRVRVDGSTSSSEAKRRLQALVKDSGASIAIDDRLALVEPRPAPVSKPLPVRINTVLSSGLAPYFIADNGSTYVHGSVLPDGSQVMSIQSSKIFFRAGDRIITYPLDAPVPFAKP